MDEEILGARLASSSFPLELSQLDQIVEAVALRFGIYHPLAQRLVYIRARLKQQLGNFPVTIVDISARSYARGAENAGSKSPGTDG